jgi:hypothetical protein
MDISGAIRRHPGRTAVAAAVLAAAFAFAMWWFTPWRLFTDDPVDEALPSGRAAPVAQPDPMTGEIPPPRPSFTTLAQGEFISLEHDSRGSALLIEAANGERFLRFEDFETSNGPDLLVYLSSKTPSGTNDWHGYDQDFVDLGPLKGNVGNQNYAIPADVDLDRYSTAVVWCRRFEVGFAAATLE